MNAQNVTRKLEDVTNKIICADVMQGLNLIPDNTVTLVCSSPPYNVKINYASTGDNRPYKDYVKWLSGVWVECYRVLRRGGRLIINIDAMTNRQDDNEEEYIRDIRTDLANELKPIGFKFYGEHVWYKSSKDPSFNGGQFNGKKTSWGSYCLPSMPAVRRNHEYILVFSKQQFKLERDTYSGDPDITDKEFQTYIASTWSIQPETRNLGGHPVPFPTELVYRCVKLYSYTNDLVVDPFCGVGTTPLVCKITNRRYIGIDVDQSYCEYASRRLASKKHGAQNILEEEYYG